MKKSKHRKQVLLRLCPFSKLSGLTALSLVWIHCNTGNLLKGALSEIRNRVNTDAILPRYPSVKH